MIKIYNTGELKIFSDRLGRVYGTEDWCMFLYSIVKMHRPETILELGAGCAVSTMWLAQAVKENETGHVWTVDNGAHWETVLKNNDNFFVEDEKKSTFADYVQYLATKFELDEHLTLISETMPPFPTLEKPIDLLFSDFIHGPTDILKILAHYLPRMQSTSSIFIDSASTLFASFALLELLIGKFNQGKFPRMLLDLIPDENKESAVALVQQSEFQLVHLSEAKERSQNSTAWLKIQPSDIRAYPKTSFH